MKAIKKKLLSLLEYSIYTIVFSCIILIIALSSCSKYTQEKAITDVNKANDKYPAPVADWLRGKYPCITKASDTVLLTKDSVIYIECPDLPDVVHVVDPNIPDTVVRTKIIKVPVTLPIRTQLITKYIEDSAKIKVLTEEVRLYTDKYNEKVRLYIDLKESRNKWRKWCLITWGVIILYFGLRIAIPKIPFLNK